MAAVCNRQIAKRGIVEATKPVIADIAERLRERLSGYEKGLQDSSARIKREESRSARWRRLALIYGGVAMALVIVAGLEAAALYWRH